MSSLTAGLDADTTITAMTAATIESVHSPAASPHTTSSALNDAPTQGSKKRAPINDSPEDIEGQRSSKAAKTTVDGKVTGALAIAAARVRAAWSPPDYGPYIRKQTDKYKKQKLPNARDSVTVKELGKLSLGGIVRVRCIQEESHGLSRKWYGIVVSIACPTEVAEAHKVDLVIVWLSNKAWLRKHMLLDFVDHRCIAAFAKTLQTFARNTMFVTNMHFPCTGDYIYGIVTDNVPNTEICNEFMVVARSIMEGEESVGSTWVFHDWEDSAEVHAEYNTV